ncbi:MAG: hypothetical protein KIH65_004740 [Candidatus Uhrbacteria bacterium]|nr:hypothetical protein [Candidatus Uhrbacteria bacterium]
MANRQWLLQSFLGMFLIFPGWLAIGFFNRNLRVSPDLFMVWYFLGGSMCSLFFGRTPLVWTAVFPSVGIVAALLILGFVVCGIPNLLIFRAVLTAPNPGLPVAILNTTSVLVFFASAGLAYVAPRFFDAVHISGRSFIGVALTIVGTSLIAMR